MLTNEIFFSRLLDEGKFNLWIGFLLNCYKFIIKPKLSLNSDYWFELGQFNLKVWLHCYVKFKECTHKWLFSRRSESTEYV